MLQIPPKPFQQIKPQSSTVYKQKKPRRSKIKMSAHKKKKKKKGAKKNKKVKKVRKKTGAKKRSKSINKSNTSKKTHSKLRGLSVKNPFKRQQLF